MATLVIALSAFWISTTGAGWCAEKTVLQDGQPLPAQFAKLVFDDTTHALSCTFNAQNTLILMQTRRGDRVADAMIMADPNPGPRLYEIDILLTDASGRPFFLQTGGHQPIDPQWRRVIDDPAVPEDTETADQRINLFLFAHQMAAGLATLPVRTDLLPERQAFAKLLPLFAGLAREAQEADIPDAASRTSDACLFHVEIQYQELLDVSPTQHSATLTKRFGADGHLEQVWTTCNHGPCAGDAGMHPKCSQTRETQCDWITEMPHCMTPFGLVPDSHVGNDDTFIQYGKVAYEFWLDVYGGTCADDELRTLAPDCY